MTPAKLTARRLMGGGALFVALGALGLVSAAPAAAAPAAAAPLVWGSAQGWVADGDLVTGYSTAVSFGGEREQEQAADVRFGPLADHAEVDGESSTVVDDDGARATSVVESATVRLGVADLVELGLLELPLGVDGSPPSEPAEDEQNETDDEDDATEPEADDGEHTFSGEDGERGAEDTERELEAEEPPGDIPMREPQETPEASPSEDDTVVIDDSNSETASGDANSVVFTVTGLTTTASAGYDGRTHATIEHGALTAFEMPVGPLDDGRFVEDDLELFDAEGDVAEDVPVRVEFEANETTFDDDDAEWDGKGVRAWLTVRIEVGDPVEENVLEMDFADSWALGSTHVSAASPEPGSGEGAADPDPVPVGSNNRLATTGSSIAALVTAAVVAVGGGSAATFLARKRTTAMDDQIED